MNQYVDEIKSILIEYKLKDILYYLSFNNIPDIIPDNKDISYRLQLNDDDIMNIYNLLINKKIYESNNFITSYFLQFYYSLIDIDESKQDKLDTYIEPPELTDNDETYDNQKYNLISFLMTILYNTCHNYNLTMKTGNNCLINIFGSKKKINIDDVHYYLTIYDILIEVYHKTGNYEKEYNLYHTKLVLFGYNDDKLEKIFDIIRECEENKESIENTYNKVIELQKQFNIKEIHTKEVIHICYKIGDMSDFYSESHNYLRLSIILSNYKYSDPIYCLLSSYLDNEEEYLVDKYLKLLLEADIDIETNDYKFTKRQVDKIINFYIDYNPGYVLEYALKLCKKLNYNKEVMSSIYQLLGKDCMEYVLELTDELYNELIMFIEKIEIQENTPLLIKMISKLYKSKIDLMDLHFNYTIHGKGYNEAKNDFIDLLKNN